MQYSIAYCIEYNIPWINIFIIFMPLNHPIMEVANSASVGPTTMHWEPFHSKFPLVPNEVKKHCYSMYQNVVAFGQHF
jgi:hypothetical protein